MQNLIEEQLEEYYMSCRSDKVAIPSKCDAAYSFFTQQIIHEIGVLNLNHSLKTFYYTAYADFS